jgi:hypothetical protein
MSCLGVDTQTFGRSVDNPFFKIKEKIMEKISFEDRTLLVRYFQHIPHIDLLKHLKECVFDILKNEDYPLSNDFSSLRTMRNIQG